MVKIFVTSFLTFALLIGCSGGGENITISCDGTKVIRTKNGNMWEYDRTEKHEKDYVFANNKLHPYNCMWSEKEIICKSEPVLDDSLSVVINIDREKGKVIELFTIRNKDGSGTYEIFNGDCKKLNKKF